MTRLYVVEGLPCSGKSTAAARLAEMLRVRGRRVCCVDEGTLEHPADYEFHAWRDGQVIPLAGLMEEALRELLPFKIYDGLPWETEAPVMLDKWREFVRTVEADTDYVFNCCLLQNPMCETMMRFGMSEEESAAHIRQIAEIIRPLSPVVVYLHTADPAAAVRACAKERPGWLEAVMDYHVNGAYGRRIEASGFAGYIACLEERQRREVRILAELPLSGHVCHDPRKNLTELLQTII
ncbi:MAG: hypothetical protein IJ438_02850 [Clostridia bacterium]|nr:hypothetical protein [Clostridia bacterium]